MAEQRIDETTEAPPETRKGGGRRRLLIVTLVVVLFGVVGGWWLLRSSPPADAAPTEPAIGEVVEVAQMTASTSDADATYVRLSFAAVLPEGVVVEQISDRLALLEDAALSTISGHSAKELRSPDGLQRVRAELTRAAKEIYPDGEVLRIVLTEMLVQ